MVQRRGARKLAAATAVLLASSIALSEAAGPLTTIAGGGAASQPAAPAWYSVDAVSVFQTGELTTAVRDAALLAAADVGAPAVVGRGFTIGMTRVRRGTTVIQQSTGSGWAFPMGVTALPLDAIAGVMGRGVAAPIGLGQIVMGATTAGIRGAQVGDTVDLMAANGTIRTYTIGLIAPDSQVGGTEIVMSTVVADQLGATIQTRVLIWAPRDRIALTYALAVRGVSTNSKVRIRKTWDPADPDLTMSMSQTKALLGEFDIYYAGISTSGWTAINSTWVSTYLASSATYPTGIRARCHSAIRADLTAALQEVQTTYPGLVNTSSNALSSTSGIDVANTNTYGGCGTGTARFSRITQNLGSISRHSWGQPLDTGTVANCQGCVPKMDCRIVRIFRKHNFAWGGNFLTADGMHFEWVGEPRHNVQYDSRYCDNLPNGRIQSTGPPSTTSRDTLFGDDGFTGGDEH